ncbi:MAG: 30S ribosomal protein S17 [Candidatus Auribacterota bacterium]|jgi:small subunit ribosomal protein S17|nr:30S ribosomal protein S17 [Candidatus Auribacterota bacterium]
MTVTSERGSRKQRSGVVVSDKMDKTVIVQIERKISHPVYKKVVKVYMKCAVHDPNNEAKVGDFVTITETRPLSKTKRWRLSGIVREGRERGNA